MSFPRRTQRNQTKFYWIGCVALLCFFLFIFMLNGSANNGVEVGVIPAPPRVKYPLPVPVQRNEDLASSIQNRASTMHLLRETYLLPENQGMVSLISTRCSKLTQTEQLLDSECTAVWLNKLRHGEITGVEKWWGFEDTHNGAITLNVGDIRGMFKPCSSKSEDTSKEVVASYLDQLMLWGQTAPVITRRILISEVEKYVLTEHDKKNFNATLSCAEGDYFVGPMIGWWNSLIPIRTVNKKELEVPELLKLRNEFKESESLLPAQMQSKYHAFYLLINILRHGKDEFITDTGDLVSLDLDRSRYQSTKAITSSSMNYTWCFTCYMDRWVYDTFQAVGPKQPETARLGYLMREVLKHEDIFEDIWNTQMGAAMNTRVEMLLECIDNCIYQFGEENVLLDEPKNWSAKDIVTYFVTHSEYKNMNGKKGPSNLDFLDNL